MSDIEYCESCEKTIVKTDHHFAICISCEGQGGWNVYCSRTCLDKNISEYNSQEEKIKDLYEHPPEFRQEAYRKGIRDALRIHGIHYDWIEDAE